MGRSNKSTSNDCADRHLGSRGSLLSVLMWRKMLALMLLLSAICAPVRSLAQSTDQEKRGLGVAQTPSPSPSS